jgi:NAD(P)-dependent dehydrogenase (short-subunit alcohol dehydrogenase family)
VADLLTGRTAVVTGAAGGIGAAICAAYAGEGATVVAVDIDGPGAGEVADRAGGVAVTADVTTVEGAAAAVEAADRLGGVDVLVNNVGHFLFPRHDFVDSTPEEWDALHRINLVHVLRMCHTAIPGMVARRRGGSIVNLTTIEVHRGIPQHTVYSAYKAAVEGFTRSLALEISEAGIRVNAIAPDITESRQVRIAEWVPPEHEPLVRTWVPLGRLGTPDDIAGVAVFLASDLSRFVTGSTMHPDGGALVAAGWYRQPAGGWTSRPLQPT